MHKFPLLLVVCIVYSILAVSQTQLLYKDKNFSYMLKLDSMLMADKINYDCVVKSITIRKLKDNSLVQVITPDKNSPDCEFPTDQIFIIEDINFDGLNDIRLLQFLPAAPNLPYYYWVYDQKLQKFKRQKDLEDITSPDFDHEKKLIYSSWRGSCCDHGLSTYQYIHGKPTLIEENEVRVENDSVYSTIKQLSAGKMRLIKRTVEKDTEEDPDPSNK